ncbi:hypothetical protein OPV22_034165 [Ensete ventricosum]|uniref:Uncharacterized protein n=1 Tax=Ensete ventricosum TaxID=4639 RepID=A0AAV8PW60_ENSVE|nr:hypothetical protein OPV22_034165 [Ensete ventricosum]
MHQTVRQVDISCQSSGTGWRAQHDACTAGATVSPHRGYSTKGFNGIHEGHACMMAVRSIIHAIPGGSGGEKDQDKRNGDGEQSRHQKVGHKSVLQSDAFYQYILATIVCPREPECMKELRRITAKHPWCVYVPALAPTSGSLLVIRRWFTMMDGLDSSPALRVGCL